jgi:hypothetical protein
MISADELSRMREQALSAKETCSWHVNVPPDSVLRLLDELEEARGERDNIAAHLHEAGEVALTLAGERDAANALLQEAMAWLDPELLPSDDLPSRIARHLKECR